MDDTKKIEVESKFPATDLERIIHQVIAMKAKGPFRETHRDEYWAHPVRQFAETQEALRIRTLNGNHYLTYKGPKSGIVAKVRHEIELPMAARCSLAEIRSFLSNLGFTSVAVVEKNREIYQIQIEKWPVSLVIDHVAQIGHFLEIEVLCAENQIREAEDLIHTLSMQLGLAAPVSDSYLSMTLRQKSKGNP